MDEVDDFSECLANLESILKKMDRRVCTGKAWVVTRYPDGTEVHAHPNHGPEDVVRAHVLGYRGNVSAMTLEHDPLHTRLAMALGLPHSPTLWGLAHGTPVDAVLVDAEEAMVLAAQRFLQLVADE